MAQQWQPDTPYPANNYATDLNNMRDMFETLRTAFSGSSAPANPVEGQIWRDTNKKLLKVRGVAAWFGVMHGDVNQKIYVYRNAAMEGWVIDTAVADCVLAFKGGSAYVNGGVLGGSWTISGLSAAHTHSIGVDGQHTHGLRQGGHMTGFSDDVPGKPAGAHSHGGQTGSAGAVTHNSNWRPRAAVGTLQRLDL